MMKGNYRSNTACATRINVVKNFLYFCVLCIWASAVRGQSDDFIVGNITIRGNQSLAEEDIRQVLRLQESHLFSRTDFDRRILKLDGIIIKNYYIARGYLSVAVTDSFAVRDDNKVDLFFRIDEGPQTIIRSIKFDGNTVVTDRQLLKLLRLKEGDPYNLIGLNANMNLVENEFNRHGKLFSRIEVYESKADSIDILFRIDEGPDVYISDYSISGNQDISTSYIVRELKFNPGDPYRQDKIDESEKRIIETGLFSFVKINPQSQAENDTTVHLKIELRKFQPREVTSEGGFYPFQFNEATEPTPSVGGNFEWRNRNIFGTTRRFSINTEANLPTDALLRRFEYLRYSVTATLSSQWFFNMRLPTSISGYYVTYTDLNLTGSDARTQKYGVAINYRYRINIQSYLRAGIQWEQFLLPELAATTEIQKRTVNLDLKIDGTDLPINPSRGNVFTFNLTSAGWILGGNREFLKMDFGISTYNRFFFNSVLAGRVKYGFIYGWDDNYTDPQYDKFYLGGSTTLRGWERFHLQEVDGEPFGQPFRLLTNWELRYPLPLNFGLVSFIDGGSLADSFEDLSQSRLFWNYGMGMVYHSPLGPIRLDYAIQADDPGNRLLVFSVLYAF